MTRETFDQKLGHLEQDLLQMGGLVEGAIEQSVQALKKQDVVLARQVEQADDVIDDLQHDLEERALILLATQQPLAGDLRRIAAIISIAGELERIGDYARGIATITLRSAGQPLLKPLIDIPRMATKACEMLRRSLDAFVTHDLEWARGIHAHDDEVDALYDQVYRELLTFMMQDPRTITRATYLLWVAHNLERIADRTTNICERTIFMVTGRQPERRGVSPEGEAAAGRPEET